MKSFAEALLLLVSLFSFASFGSNLTPGSQLMRSIDDGAKLFSSQDRLPPSFGDEEREQEPIENPDDPIACEGNYFDWGQGRDQTGYCYEFNRDGHVAHNGQNLANRFCEVVAPSYYNLARARDGAFYCYQFTPYHVVLNQGRPVPNRFCP